jgi:hypothetical protein
MALVTFFKNLYMKISVFNLKFLIADISGALNFSQQGIRQQCMLQDAALSLPQFTYLCPCY